MDIPGFGTAFALQVRRDLQLAFRNVGQLANPLMFFIMVTTLFPLALDPGPQKLSMIAPAVVWVWRPAKTVVLEGTVCRTWRARSGTPTSRRQSP